MLTDRQALARLLDALGVAYTEYDNADPMCLEEEARKLGAVESISVRGMVDAYFDAKGKIVGTATIYMNSFEKPPRKRKK